MMNLIFSKDVKEKKNDIEDQNIQDIENVTKKEITQQIEIGSKRKKKEVNKLIKEKYSLDFINEYAITPVPIITTAITIITIYFIIFLLIFLIPLLKVFLLVCLKLFHFILVYKKYYYLKYYKEQLILEVLCTLVCACTVIKIKKFLIF